MDGHRQLEPIARALSLLLLLTPALEPLDNCLLFVLLGVLQRSLALSDREILRNQRPSIHTIPVEV